MCPGLDQIARVQKHRDQLRQAGLCPVQLWVPDTRKTGFAAACSHQCHLVAQADFFAQHTSLAVLLVTSTLVDAPMLRVTGEPSAGNGLRKPSQVMIDKIMTVKRERVEMVLGQIETGVLLEIERRLAVFLGIAK